MAITGTKTPHLRTIATALGYDKVFDMLEDTIRDEISPGICMACDAVVDSIEADQTEGHCDTCGQNRIVSALILADMI